jgi:hypothetical protein
MHHALVVGTDVPVADVISENHEDVWLVLLRTYLPRDEQGPKRDQTSRFSFAAIFGDF